MAAERPSGPAFPAHERVTDAAGLWYGRGAMTRLLLTLAVLAACAAALVPTGAARTHAPKATTSCPAFTGTTWKLFKRPLHGVRTGNHYTLNATNYSCATAKKYAPALTRFKLKVRTAGTQSPVTGGPKGYRCVAVPDANGHAMQGMCTKGRFDTAKSFNWAPEQPKSTTG
jgi:hypothetical protein